MNPISLQFQNFFLPISIPIGIETRYFWNVEYSAEGFDDFFIALFSREMQ